MSNRQNNVNIAALTILVVLLLVSLTYANLSYTRANPGGNDFLSRWVGTRLFLTRGLSPYSEQVTRAIHQMAYGRAAQPGEDQMLFAYPFYTALVIGPFALVEDYALARAIWMTALETALVLIVFASIALARWRMPAWLVALLLIFALLWYYGLRPVINGNPSVMVALFLALALIAIRSNHDPLAGFLLALATIKPQMVILIIPLVIVWAASHRRWPLIWSFVGSLILISLTFGLFFPDWIIQNIRQVLSYPTYTLPSTPGEILTVWLPGVGKQTGWGITLLLSLVLLWEWWSVRGKDFQWFLWTVCLTLVVTNMIGIKTATENYPAMFPALILIFASWEARWRRAGRWLVLVSITLLFFDFWTLFLTTLQAGDQPTQNPVMFFPYPIFLLLCLYWVRWWAIRPPRLFLEHFRETGA